MANNNGLLIAALVAIVAVVGLVILFKGGVTGNQIVLPGPEPLYRGGAVVSDAQAYNTGVVAGETAARDCLLVARDQPKCCSEQCSFLSQAQHRGCSYICQLRVAQAASRHIDTV